MAAGASSLDEQVVDVLNRSRTGAADASRRRLVQEFHEGREGNNVGGTRVSGREPRFAFRRAILGTARVLLPFGWEIFVGHAHFDVVSLAREDHQRLVLRLPAESRHRAIVAIGVDVAFDAEQRPHAGWVACQIVPNGCIGNRFDQPRAEDGSRNSEDDIVAVGEILLRDHTTWGLVGAAGDGEDVVHAAIRSPVGVHLEPDLSHRTV